MKPATFATDQFPWKQLAHDDFMCEIDSYVFRVEQMGLGHWWWRVSYLGEPIYESTDEFSSSKYQAIGRCEGMYLAHSITSP